MIALCLAKSDGRTSVRDTNFFAEGGLYISQRAVEAVAKSQDSTDSIYMFLFLFLFIIGSLLRLGDGFFVLRHAFSHRFDFVLTRTPVSVVSHAFLHVVEFLYAS